MKTFYTYEDWTLELEPRCFYVGKGDDDRVVKIKRNQEHGAITERLGHKRVIVLTTSDENAALDLERKLIKERHTHPRDPKYNGIGCNKTLGGQGNSGRIVTEETGRKISEAKRGKRPNKTWTQAERDAMSARMSLLHKGKSISVEQRAMLAERMADPVIKANMIAKVMQSINLKYATDPAFVQRIRDTRVRGEQSSSPFTELEVRAMRSEWDCLDRTMRGATKVFCVQWAAEKNVTPEAVYGIVKRKSWKHLP